MKILVLIPARGGSKRLPRKNILSLGGKPLIAWSIDVAKDIPEICDILVSTDDPEIAEISKEAGALVPWLRPAELSTDTASSVNVALHALDWYKKAKGKVEGILLLQPTSPFRTKEYIKEGISLFLKNPSHSVIGVTQIHHHPMWTFKIEHGLLVPFIKGGGINVRSQNLPPAYSLSGNFYLVSPNLLEKNNTFITEKSIPLLCGNQYEAIDIDTEWDFFIAQNTLIQMQL